MIKGKAKLEFGTGDIRFTGCVSHGVGALCLITQNEHHIIGERIPVSDTWSTKEAEVIMTFTQVASIDALIAELSDVKAFMEGKFPDGQEFSGEMFDFDSFMNPPVEPKSYPDIDMDDAADFVLESGLYPITSYEEFMDGMKKIAERRKEQCLNRPVKTKFSVGDYVWFTVTPGDKRNPYRSKRTDPICYKVLQVIQTSKKHGVYESYNTKDGGFSENDIGVTAFHSREEAFAKL